MCGYLLLVILLIVQQEEGTEEEEFYAAFAATGVSYDTATDEKAAKELKNVPVLSRALYQVLFQSSFDIYLTVI